ncbi:MAG: DUF4276 family protein [Chloroflexi bacterium]|nr:DUF4276 family protein [Chloroflexota bacterium]
MNKLIVVVEGQTEQTFVDRILRPHLRSKGVYDVFTPLLNKSGTRGGIVRYGRARSVLLKFLKQDREAFITTMVDYYGLPHNWPERDTTATLPHSQKAIRIEKAIAQDICREMGNSFNAARFSPYIQMHEFEALLFSQPGVLAQVMQRSADVASLEQIAAEFNSPEEINDHADTALSKRLLRLFPDYNKVLYGNIAAKRIGLQIMREKCPHFHDWVTQLEALGAADVG